IVNVGRYVMQKNQAMLIDALASLDRPLKALLVGYGELEEELKAQVAAAGLADRGVLTDRREDVPDLVAAADLFALSSEWEAMPLVILEALQLGTPIVTTKAGAISDVIEDGKTGLLVERRDTAGMADAIARVLDDRELASRLAATGQAFAG